MKTYVILDPERHMVKIGKAGDPVHRLRCLQTSVCGELSLVGVIDHDCERELHKRFETSRKAREWFHLSAEVTGWIHGEFGVQFDVRPQSLGTPEQIAAALVEDRTGVILNGRWGGVDKARTIFDRILRRAKNRTGKEKADTAMVLLDQLCSRFQSHLICAGYHLGRPLTIVFLFAFPRFSGVWPMAVADVLELFALQDLVCVRFFKLDGADVFETTLRGGKQDE